MLKIVVFFVFSIFLHSQNVDLYISLINSVPALMVKNCMLFLMRKDINPTWEDPKNNEAFLLIKKRKITFKNYYYLSKKNDLKQAAKNLYSLLRNIKKEGYKMIAVEKIPNIGIGKTINDRLNRASKY